MSQYANVYVKTFGINSIGWGHAKVMLRLIKHLYVATKGVFAYLKQMQKPICSKPRQKRCGRETM